MKLVFLGNNGMWNKVLNKELLENFDNLEDIESIITCHNYETLKTYDIIVPLLESDILKLYENNIIKNAIMPSLNNFKILCCKHNFNEFINSMSFQQYVPTTYNNLDEITQLPIILKRFDLNSGRGSFIINSNIFDNNVKSIVLNTVLEKDYEIKTQISKQNNMQLEKLILDKYIIQEYLINPIEYVSFIVFKNNNILECITYQYNYESNNYIKGAIYESDARRITKIQLEQQYLDVFKNILIELDYFGICNIDFKIQNGLLKIFEINPRLGGSLMLDMNKNDLIVLLKSMFALLNN